jgi:ribonucleoside-diphosphate reductase alpha chain
MAHSVDFHRNGAGHAKAARNGSSKTVGRTEEDRATIPPARALSSKEPVTAKRTVLRDKARPAAATKAEKAGRKVKHRQSGGVSLSRRFSVEGTDPLDAVTYERRSSAIHNPDGSVVFKMEGAEVPAAWSQLATDILISKYFRKAGLHGDKDTGETSVRQVVHRLAHTIRTAADDFGGYFATKADADAFEAELSFLLVHQYGAFNSPVWFNLGLWHEYGIAGSGGNWAWELDHDDVGETEVAYERPQCSACFIQAAKDDLMSIYELVKSEARLFKYGSGTGSNFSAIRGKQEKLSGGGTSSGLM